MTSIATVRGRPRKIVELRPNGTRLIAFPCPNCGGHTEVKDSRPGAEKYGISIRRRRKCVDCGDKITTLERAKSELEDPRIANVRALVRELQVALDELPPGADWDDL